MIERFHDTWNWSIPSGIRDPETLCYAARSFGYLLKRRERLSWTEFADRIETSCNGINPRTEACLLVLRGQGD